MADRIKGKSAKASLVFHDGTSMIVINKDGPFDVDAAHEKRLVDAGVINSKSQLDHDKDGAPGGSEAHEPPALAGNVTVADGATNAQIVEAIEAKRKSVAEGAPKELEAVEGHAASVLVSIDDDMFIVNAPWLESPEPFDNAEAAEARQAELREEGPPEGWEPADEGAPGETNENAAP
jgi:hypothetical protein